MSDKGYAKLISIIKTLAETKDIMIGTMKTGTVCQVNELLLEADDYYMSEHLQTGYVIKQDDGYAEVDPLRQGDIVLVAKINDEKYVVIERLVK